MSTGIIELDLHGLDTAKAKERIDRTLSQAGSSTYRVRVIHGFHGGCRIKSMIQEEYGYGREARVLRMEHGANQGITELILREY